MLGLGIGINKFVKGVSGWLPFCRYFTTLDGVADYYTIPTVTLTGDFKVALDFSDNNIASSFSGNLFGDASLTSYIRIAPNVGQIHVFQNGVSSYSSAGVFTADSKLNTWELERVGQIFTVYINDVSFFTFDGGAVGNFTIDIMGKRSASYLSGVISEVKIYDNSVSTDLIRYYKIDEDLSATSTIIDSGSDGSNGTAISISSSELFTLVGNDWEGSELVTNGNFATDTDWAKTGTTISDGVAIFDGAVNANGRLQQTLTNAISGTNLRLKYEVVENTATTGDFNLYPTAGLTLQIGTLTLPDTIGNQTYDFIADDVGQLLYLRYLTLDNLFKIDNVSVKRILQAPPTVEEILTDGSTVLWVDSQENITKNGSDLVSLWGDKSGNGNDLVQATETNRPTWNSNGILFDGVDNFMKAAFTLNQPEFIYIVFKQVTFTNVDKVFDGNSANTGFLTQSSPSPELKIYGGSALSTGNGDLALDTYGIVRVLFNGASSTFQINETTQITGNFGASSMGGFSLGARQDGVSPSHIEVKEVIIRNVADSAQDEGTIYNYLADKYSI